MTFQQKFHSCSGKNSNSRCLLHWAILWCCFPLTKIIAILFRKAKLGEKHFMAKEYHTLEKNFFTAKLSSSWSIYSSALRRHFWHVPDGLKTVDRSCPRMMAPKAGTMNTMFRIWCYKRVYRDTGNLSSTSFRDHYDCRKLGTCTRGIV